jgi:predicted metal-dependent peptidase
MSKISVLDKAKATIVLDYPFFSSILLRKPMTADPKIQTIGINAHGHIRYNPEWIESLSVKQAVFVLCHEVLHYAGMDAIRVGNRDKKQWNQAADEFINDTLINLQIGEPPASLHTKAGARENTREELYDMIVAQPQSQKGKGKGKPDSSGDGDPMGDDIDYDDEMTDSEASEAESEAKLVVAEAAAAAKMRGNLPGLLEKFATDAVQSKVPWYDILERFMTERMSNDLSWRKPNRRFMASEQKWYLPTLDSEGAMGELAVQVDISGSISREEIKHYNGHLKRIVEMCRPQKIHVIYTDTEVQKHEVFDRPEDMEITYHSGGGTDMRAGFHYLDKEDIKPVCMVTLTDGYTPFPDHTELPAIWCISSEVQSPTGETIHFDLNDA